MGRRPDYAETVRKHHPRAEGWLVASREPCIAIQRREILNVDRVLHPTDPGDLPDPAALPSSWLLAVLLCPGDDTTHVAVWTRSLPAEDRDRVRFYHHPDVDLHEALAAWYEQGLEDPRTFEVRDFKTFHKQFGRHFNDQVYRDATGWSPPSPPSGPGSP